MSLLSLLSIETGASIPTLQRIIASAPSRYKVYEIPKRTGGTRTIAHPAKELKILQRVILREILDKIQPSSIAMAYVKGRGIRFNAEQHAGQRWVLKLDFNQFFPSITPKDWDRNVRRFDQLKPHQKDKADLHRLLFWGNGEKGPRCLSIGAPTSPSISNLVCHHLDLWMIGRAEQLGVRVTRYADDITVSGEKLDPLLRFETELRRILNESETLQLTLNEKKRGVYGPGERKMVTGLILTPDGRVSLGRERKREISSLVHKFKMGVLDEKESMRAKGLLGFALAAEHSFFESLSRKYGQEIILSLQKFEGGPDYTEII